MINKIEEEQIVLEIRDLVRGVETAKDEMNVYCELMKQLFLRNSNSN